MKQRRSIVAAGVAALAASVLTVSPAHAAVTINGSGSTAVKNLLDVCIPDYQKTSGNTVNYAGGGSGAGRSAFTAGTVDFAFSDAAYGKSDAKPTDFNYIPNVSFPLAMIYNLPSVKDPINLSGDTLANIFAGKITKWNDPAIVADNNKTIETPVYKTQVVTDKKTKKKTTVTVKDKSGKPVIASVNKSTVSIALPNTAITVWYRSDKSGSTGILTNYLTTLAPSVWSKAGSAGNQTFTSAFPGDVPAGTFQGASGSDGVANGIASKEGSIGYAETSYATERKLGVANIKNAAGEYVAPTADGTASFLNDFAPGAKGTVAVNVLSKASGAYPIASFSYGLAYGSGKDADKQKAVKEFMTFVLGDCAAKYAVSKGYSPVTGRLADIAKAAINDIG